MTPSRWFLVLVLSVLAVPALAEGPVAPSGAAPAAAPAPTAPGPEAEPGYVPSGQVRLRQSASYDATRVRGPNVNLTLTADGRWGGTVAGRPVRLQVTPERITGAGVNLVVSRPAGTLSVEGTWAGARVVVTATKDSFRARLGDQRVDLTRNPDGSWRQLSVSGEVLPVRFQGSADQMPDVPMPQWILAVIGAM